MQPLQVDVATQVTQLHQRSEWPDPAPVRMRDVVWSATSNGELAIDASNYANLAYNMAELRRYIEQQRAVIDCYRGKCAGGK